MILSSPCRRQFLLVLSEQHAEAWEEGGRVFVKDVKSSSGTFINDECLSYDSNGTGGVLVFYLLICCLRALGFIHSTRILF